MVEALRRADNLTTFIISKCGSLSLLEPSGLGIGLPIPVLVINVVGLQALASWDCGIESCQGHGCLSLESVACFQEDISATC